MRKMIFALITVSAILALGASSLLAEGAMFGVKGGINLASFIGEDAGDASIKIGGVGGAFLCYSVTNIFAIQPELLFTMKGAMDEKRDEEENAIEVKKSVSYVEIPFLFKLLLPTEGRIKPALFAGPGLGILISSKRSNGDEFDMKDYTESVDIGAVVGGSVGYETEKGAFCFDVRYEIGFKNLYEYREREKTMPIELEEKNSVISFLVGYGFAF